MTSLARLALTLPIRAYRYFLSPLLGPTCRFEPSCSRYALDAIETHGALAGSWLALKRIARCQPWGGFGVDLVPPRSGLEAPIRADLRF